MHKSTVDTLNTLCTQVYMDAEAHGLWNNTKALANHITPREDALRHMAAERIRAEVQEAMDAANNPDHYAEELADVIITALSAAGLLGIDIGTAVSQKILFNRCRPYQHL